MILYKAGYDTGQLWPTSFYRSKLSIVYDCGTLSQRDKLNSRIDRFKNSLGHDKLDVLFIWHIDDDHINGIPELLNGINCDKVYLPYLTPIERLFVAIRHGDSDSANIEDYMNFLKSPHDFLNSENFDINEIIYIKGNSEQSIEQSSVSEQPLLQDNINRLSLLTI